MVFYCAVEESELPGLNEIIEVETLDRTLWSEEGPVGFLLNDEAHRHVSKGTTQVGA